MDFDGGMKICEIAEKLDLPHSTVRTIIKDKQRILEALKNAHSLNSSVIRKRHGIIAEMETLLKVWCENQMRVNNCAVDQSVVCSEAKRIFARLKEQAGDAAKVVTFAASNGWYHRFKRRCDWHNIGTGQGYSLWTSSENLVAQPIYLPEVYDLKLVTEVEKNPMLYDLNDPSFRNKELSVSKWNEMGELLGITAERARARWTTLKACYSRSLTLSHNFYLSEPMAFLLPHMNIEKPASELPTEKSYTDQTSVEIKSEPDSDVDSSPGDMSEANMTSPANETCSRAAESTTVDAAEGSEDLEMKVEEIHEFPLTTTTSFRYHVPGHGPSTSRCHGSELCPPISNQQQRMPVSKRGKANPGKKLAPTRADNPSASGVKEQSRGESTTSSSEDHTSESDLEYFKGLLSLIKQLSAKRKRQLFGTFAAELFRHLDEQEND
ncbi:unnamed protein product [Lymnaea stagnalis]|uniref:Uncharacterized protein n=1 Tax=Lymnaea stagnalis TaxID=6523 RepID=A0AAV2HFY7_LYMST